MKRFLIKFFSFLLGLAVLQIFVFFLLRSIELDLNKKRDSQSIAIVGHSHAHVGMDDELLERYLKVPIDNYGVGGQSMFWSVIGARKLQYQGVRSFIIELTNNSYTTGWKTTDYTRGLREAKKKYFLSADEWSSLIRNDMKFTLNLFSKVSLPSIEVQGGYKKNDRKFNGKLVVENRGSHEREVDFDDSVIHNFICEHDSVSFVIVRAPQHPDYYKLLSDADELFFLAKLNDFKKHDNCLVMDFGHIFSEDSLFADLDHLNNKGADLFSSILADSLSDHIHGNELLFGS